MWTSEHEDMEPQLDVFHRVWHVSLCSWDNRCRSNGKAHVNFTRWLGSKWAIPHWQCDIYVFIVASTDDFEVGCLCLIRINWQLQLTEITGEGPCQEFAHECALLPLIIQSCCYAKQSSYSPSPACSAAMDHKACYRLGHLQLASESRYLLPVTQWAGLYHSVPATLLTLPRAARNSHLWLLHSFVTMGKFPVRQCNGQELPLSLGSRWNFPCYAFVCCLFTVHSWEEPGFIFPNPSS